MSEAKELEHKKCNLLPVLATAAGVQIGCKTCGRDIVYIDQEILKHTPWTIQEVKYYLFHKDWEWNKPCDRPECEFRHE